MMMTSSMLPPVVTGGARRPRVSVRRVRPPITVGPMALPTAGKARMTGAGGAGAGAGAGDGWWAVEGSNPSDLIGVGESPASTRRL
jgi:hypothetical protein